MARIRPLLLPIWLALAASCASSPVKGEPDVVLAEGKKRFEAKDWNGALACFRGVRKYNESSDEAEEALFLDAECRRHLREGTRAFETYKKFIEQYPTSQYAVGVAVGEYELGNAFLEGKIPGFLFFKADRGYGVRVLESMQVSFPNHSLADDALVKVAEFQLGRQEYDNAAVTLERLLAEYPRSENMLWARFQLARSFWLQNQGPRYDERLLTRSRRAFEDYIGTARLLGQEEAQAEQIAKAEETIKRIDERRAESEYLIGRFYERTKHPTSAVYYYRHCAQAFPGTKGAAASAERLKTLTARQEAQGQ